MAQAIAHNSAHGQPYVVSFSALAAVAVAVAATFAIRHELARGGPDNEVIAGLTYETAGGDGATSRALVVTSVQSDSPAAAAGIASGDVIALVNGVTVHSSRDVMRAIRRQAAGRVNLRVFHGAQSIDKALPLASARDK